MQSLKIRLELNDKQKTLALQHAGVARHAYNWGLDVCNKAFENKEKDLRALIYTKNWWQKSKKNIVGIMKFQNAHHNKPCEI